MKPSNYSVMWPQDGNDTPCVGVLACEGGTSIETWIDNVCYLSVYHSHTREHEQVAARTIKRYHPFHDDHGKLLTDLNLKIPYLHPSA